MQAYFETGTRFTSGGRKIEFVYEPRKMPAYSIAKALHHRRPKNPGIYEDELVSKFSDYIDRTLALAKLREERVSKDERAAFKREAKAFRRLMKANIYNIIKDLLDWRRHGYVYPWEDGYVYPLKDDDGSVVRPLTREDREVNRAIFNRNMQRAICHLATSSKFSVVMQDYLRVQELVENGDFPALAAWCSPVIQNWTSVHPIKRMAPEDQYQEGLLTLWGAAPNYEGRNFARFTTMIRGALRKKFLNSMRFMYADKRRINSLAVSVGSATDSDYSYYSHLLDRLSFEMWTRGQREDGEDPFRTVSVQDIFRETRVKLEGDGLRQVEAYVRNGRDWRLTTVADEGNFPHLNEHDVDVMADFNSGIQWRPHNYPNFWQVPGED